jgi:hypothetical protein
MIVHSGFQSFDFQHSYELPKPLTFATEHEALRWLKELSSKQPNLISQFRNNLARWGWDDPESRRLTDPQIIERLAVLLYSRRTVVIARETRTASGTPTPRTETLAPPFPLSERKPRARCLDWKKSKTWISIELQDPNGNPVPGEEYRLELPDGRVMRGKVDSHGAATVTGIDPGQCKVSFPRLDASSWNLAGSKA